MSRLKIGYAPQVKPSWMNDTLEAARKRALAALEALDADVVAGPLLASDADAEKLAAEFRRQDVDLMVIHFLTFSLGSMTPILAQRVGVPVVFWGMPEPAFDGHFDVVSTRVVGDRHLRLLLRPAGGEATVEAIAFNKAVEAADGLPARLRFAYHLDLDDYRGASGLQLRVAHWEAAG